jgi:4-hydroxybenzoyl-CoA thioesterase
MSPPLFEHVRTITWSDADAAGIAYTGRFPNFALEAIEAWFAERLGMDWYRMHRELGGGTPFVHMRMDFRIPLRPRDVLRTEVRLRRAGRSSLEFSVRGLVSGQVSFEGRFVCAFVEDATQKSRPAPEPLRVGIERELDPD